MSNRVSPKAINNFNQKSRFNVKRKYRNFIFHDAKFTLRLGYPQFPTTGAALKYSKERRTGEEKNRRVDVKDLNEFIKLAKRAEALPRNGRLKSERSASRRKRDDRGE